MLRGIHTLLLLALFLALRAQAQDAAPNRYLNPAQQPAAAPQPQTERKNTPASPMKSPAQPKRQNTPSGATVTGFEHPHRQEIFGRHRTPKANSRFSDIVRGRYVLRIEFMGFSLFTQEVVPIPRPLPAKIDAELILSSREHEASQQIQQHQPRRRSRFPKASPSTALFRLLPEATPALAATARRKTPATSPLSL